MGVACRETLRDAAKVQEDGSDYRLSIRITLDFDPVTPWQKGRVAFHVVDQCIHLRCAVIEQYRFVYDRHLDVSDFDKIAILYKEACAFMTIADNKKAFHDYFIEDTYEAGIALVGTEVKSLRMGKCSIKESYVRVEQGELFIYGMNISPYEKGNIFNKDPLRVRKLLLHRCEINKIDGKLKEKGLTLVPLKVYFKDSLVKVEIGMARGKKLYDKRQDIAKKDQRREAERDFKVKNLY